MENQFERIKYGWLTNDVVDMKKEWCAVCAKAKWHEGYKGWLICLGCGEQTSPNCLPQPAFQIERFLKEGL